VTNASSTGTLTLRSDTSALTSGVAASKNALAGMDAVARRAGPALGDMSKAAKGAKIGTDLLTGGILGVVKGLGPWGLAFGVAADVLISYTANSAEATKATHEFWRAIEGAGNAMEKIARAADAKIVHDERFEQAIRNVTAAHRDNITAVENEIAASKGYGEATDELTIKLLKLQAEALIAESKVQHMLETDDEFQKRRSKLLADARKLERDAELAQIEADAAASSRAATKIKVGGKKKAGKPEKDTSTDWEFHRELEAAREAAEEEKRMREQDELDFQTMNEKFDLIMEQRAEAAEQAKEAAHERELARIEEEKRAREEQLAQIERITSAATGHAQMAVAGILSVADARNNARRAAQAQGKTEAQVAQAVKQAELQAKAARMQSLRDMMAAQAVQQFFLGVGALATTWGIPNPASILHFAAAAGLGAGAAIAGARANSLSDQASGAGGNGGGAFGPASGRGGGGGGSRGGTGGQALPPGSGNAIPGSPTPQPTPQQQNGGGIVLHLTVQGDLINDKQHIDKIARRIEERVHSKPRRTGT
jgi:hypothetical protein